MNETVRRQITSLRIKAESLKGSVKTSPKGAAITLTGLLRQACVFDNMAEEQTVAREIRDIKQSINCTSHEIANSPKQELLHAARTLGELRTQHENIVSGIRANLDVVEDGLRDLADREDANIAALIKARDKLEARLNIKKFALAYVSRVTDVTNAVETLSKTEPGRVKPVLRKLVTNLSSLAELMNNYGDERADGTAAIREFVKQALKSLETK